MSSKNTLIVVSILVGSILVILIVAYLRDSGFTDFDQGQRFTAKPGTTRENAILLTSSKRPTTADPEGGIAQRAEDRESGGPLDVKSLSGPDDDPVRGGPAGETARAALNSLSAEAGLAMIEQALAEPATPDQQAILLEAQGQLYAQLAEPDYARAMESLDRAASLAPEPVLAGEIKVTAAQVLVQAGRDVEARDRLADLLDSQPPMGAAALKLQLLLGQVQERTGDLAAAERTFNDVLGAVRGQAGDMDAESAEALVRLAALRLTALYRKQDRGAEAEALTNDLKRRLNQVEPL